MRLTCPNCSAQYEVDDQVIPDNGRDVQCSACSHTWFQYPISIALQMRAEDADDDDEDVDTDAPASDGTGRAAPRIDKSVLDVLREEAEREMSERRRARGEPIETQGDLGLNRPTRPSRPTPAAAAATFDGDDDGPPPIPADVDSDPGDAPRGRRGRAVLPDIEELSSTLEPAGDEREDLDEMEHLDTSEPESNGFRQGMTVVLLVGAGLVILYVLAPVLVANIPALDGPLRAYVNGIDGLRSMLADTLRGLLGGG